MSEGLVSRTQLIKQFLMGIFGIACGIVILSLLSFITKLSLISALILGGIIALIGLFIFISKDAKFTGLIVFFSGGFILLSKVPILGSMAKVLIVLSGIILIIVGIIALFLFIKNLTQRM